jgi:hypothetical protein
VTPAQRRGATGIAGEAAGLSIGAVLAILAAIRRGKAFHPDGVVHDGRLAIGGAPHAPSAELLSRPGEHRALVRFSRAVGLPRPIPDLLGLSLRLPDVYGPGRHQDFLLVTSADLPVLHHIFLPSRDLQQRPFTSALPYRAGGDLLLVGALPRVDSTRPAGVDELDRLDAAAASGRLAFDLTVAPMSGRWNCGGGLRPAGWLNQARDRAYRLSQGAWRRTRPDGAALQDAADRSSTAQSRGVRGPQPASASRPSRNL